MTSSAILAGDIGAIRRYPIKSFGGESLNECDIEPYGMLGDRFAAFYDESKQGWSKYITCRNIPNLLSYQARYIDGRVEAKAPDGRVFGWDEALHAEIQSLAKTRIAMSRLQAPHPEDPHLLSVDVASILLVTDASLRRLEATWGKPLDPRRFRSNLVVRVADDSASEGDWIGKRLEIGDVQLRVDQFCERCVVITMDPDTRDKDPSLLRQVNEKLALRFGVYASVLKPGRIRIGDQVNVVES